MIVVLPLLTTGPLSFCERRFFSVPCPYFPPTTGLWTSGFCVQSAICDNTSNLSYIQTNFLTFQEDVVSRCVLSRYANLRFWWDALYLIITSSIYRKVYYQEAQDFGQLDKIWHWWSGKILKAVQLKCCIFLCVCVCVCTQPYSLKTNCRNGVCASQ